MKLAKKRISSPCAKAPVPSPDAAVVETTRQIKIAGSFSVLFVVAAVIAPETAASLATMYGVLGAIAMAGAIGRRKKN